MSHRPAGRALTIALIGAPVALSVGVPAGTLLGSQVGWRGAFLAMSVKMVALIGGVRAFIPRTSGLAADRHMWFVDVLRRPGIAAFMLTVIPNEWKPQRTEIDGLGIDFYRIRSPEPGALPGVMTHGRPGSRSSSRRSSAR